MISWKHSFKKLSEEYEIAKKKKQALDNLLNSSKISQSTHELVSKEIDEALVEIEKQQKALMEKMDAKIAELEGQIRTLELLLANSEIRHVTGELDEETYQREISLLTIGLETAKQELDAMKDAINQLSQTDVAMPKVLEVNMAQTQEPTQESSQCQEEAKTTDVAGEERQESSN